MNLFIDDITSNVLPRVHNLLSPKLKKWNKILKQETEDMKEDFMMSMKKAIVDFALRDPDMVILTNVIYFIP